MPDAPQIADLLTPSSIAVVGASQDLTKFGGRVLRVLQLHGFAGKIYPINRRRSEVFGLPAYPSLGSVPGSVDLAVLCVPQADIAETLAACAGKRVKCCIVLAAKFGETGEAGKDLERQLLADARRHGIRLIGPNCLGFLIRSQNLVVLPSSATFLHNPLPDGWIGIVSQSGSMASTLLDLALGMGLGVSAAFAIGNQVDLATPDFVRYLADDPGTRVICCYLEGLPNLPDFLAALEFARERGKPVVVLKAGRTQQGGRAAFTHTASLASDYAALAAYLEDAGAILQRDPKSLLLTAGLLGTSGPVPLDSVIMVTNSGGGGAVVADRLADVDVPLRELNATTRARLQEVYFESHATNPVDWGGSDIADEDVLLSATFSALSSETGHPLVLVTLLTNPDMRQTAEDLATHVSRAGHPSLFLVVPGKVAEVSREVLRERGMLVAGGVDEVVDSIAAVMRRRRSGEQQRPVRPEGLGSREVTLAPERLLVDYRIPYVRTAAATSSDEAVALAATLGFPVAVKLVSSEITHKTEVNGVALDVRDAEGVRAAWKSIRDGLTSASPSATMDGVLVQRMVSRGLELLVGFTEAEGVGPVVVVAAGGVLAELLGDRVVLPVPCAAGRARDALGTMRIHRLFEGYRNGPVHDVEALVDLIVRLSWLANDHRDELAELELNPVILEGAEVVAVDFRYRVRSGNSN